MAFTESQTQQIEIGGQLTEMLRRVVSRALGLEKSTVETKRHTYIFSSPGAGKKFTVQAIANGNNVKLVNIQGAASMRTLALKKQLATE